MGKRIGFALLSLFIVLGFASCQPKVGYMPPLVPGPITMTETEVINEVITNLDPQKILSDAEKGSPSGTIWSEVVDSPSRARAASLRSTVNGTKYVLVHFNGYAVGMVKLSGDMLYTLEVEGGSATSYSASDSEDNPIRVEDTGNQEITLKRLSIPKTTISDSTAIVFETNDSYTVSETATIEIPGSAIVSTDNESIIYEEVKNEDVEYTGKLSAKEVASLFSFEDILYMANEKTLPEGLSITGLEGTVSGQTEYDFTIGFEKFDTGLIVITGVIDGTTTMATTSNYGTILDDFSLKTANGAELVVQVHGDSGNYRLGMDISGSASANFNSNGFDKKKDTNTYLRLDSLSGSFTVNGKAASISETRGTGTENDPYLIYTPGELHSIIRYLDADENQNKIYISLENDIDLEAYTYAAWGKPQAFNAFDFNGNWNTINGLNHYFCATVDENSSIHEVVFTNKTKTGIVSTLSGTVENVTIESGSISSSFNSNVSSIANTLEKSGVIRNVVNKANVENTDTSSGGNRYAGGIVGLSKGGTIENTVNYGNVSDSRGGTIIGGIVGYVAENDSQPIRNVINHGSVSITGIFSGTAGGIAGSVYTATTISGAENSGNISGNIAGGIVGETKGSSAKKIEHAVNSGAINGKDYAGGIVGRADCAVNIAGAINTGFIEGYTASGIMYTGAGSSVIATYSTGSTSGTEKAGIAGLPLASYKDYITFDACYYTTAGSGVYLADTKTGEDLAGITKVEGETDWTAAETAMNEALSAGEYGFSFSGATESTAPTLPSVEDLI